MEYLDFLQGVHERLDPDFYLELGVGAGESMALSRCVSVGVDPLYAITSELDCDVSLYRSTVDEYFSRPDPRGPIDGERFDLAVLGGPRLFEVALREFVHAERHCAAAGAIVVAGALPETAEDAARVGGEGDVYRLAEVLAEYRPDLTVLPVAADPDGLLLVLGLDPGDRTLSDRYDEIVARFRAPDPQPVPDDLLDRFGAVPAERALAAGFWAVLAGGGAGGSIRSAIASAVEASVGPAFAGAVG